MTEVEDSLTAEVMDHNGLVLVALSGELTELEGPIVHAAVDAALGSSPRNLQLGLVGVSFVDSGGLRVLVRAREKVTAAEVPLQLLVPSEQVRRLLAATGLDSVFDVIG